MIVRAHGQMTLEKKHKNLTNNVSKLCIYHVNLQTKAWHNYLGNKRFGLYRLLLVDKQTI